MDTRSLCRRRRRRSFDLRSFVRLFVRSFFFCVEETSDACVVRVLYDVMHVVKMLACRLCV